jgi:hypothetical protein
MKDFSKSPSLIRTRGASMSHTYCRKLLAPQGSGALQVAENPTYLIFAG